MVSCKLATHFFTYSGLFGVTCYQSFFAGITAYKALPVEMFSKLQHKIFPGYFLIQTVLSLLLLLTVPYKTSNAGMTALATPFAGAAANLVFIMPKVHKIVIAREAQMEKEGKGYKDPTASEEMKALNKKFAKLHGISMIFNLGLIAGMFYYGHYFISRVTLI